MADNAPKAVLENKSIVEIPQIYYGTEAPSDDLGKDGDLYIRYTN